MAVEDEGGAMGADERLASDGCGEWTGNPPSPDDLAVYDGLLAPAGTAGVWHTVGPTEIRVGPTEGPTGDG